MDEGVGRTEDPLRVVLSPPCHKPLQQINHNIQKHLLIEVYNHLEINCQKSLPFSKI